MIWLDRRRTSAEDATYWAARGVPVEIVDTSAPHRDADECERRRG